MKSSYPTRLILVLPVFLVLSGPVRHAAATEAAEEDKPSDSVGPGKAVEKASKASGLQLSPKARQALGIELQKFSAFSPWVLKTSIVKQLGETHVYRYRDGWFKLIEVTVATKKGDKVRLSSEELAPGDDIVVAGANLLRVAELEVWGGEIDTCAD